MVMIFKSNDVDKKQNYHLYSDPALWILNLSYIFILFYLYTLPQTMSVIFFRRFCPGCKNIVNIPIKGRSKTLKTKKNGISPQKCPGSNKQTKGFRGLGPGPFLQKSHTWTAP